MVVRNTTHFGPLPYPPWLNFRRCGEFEMKQGLSDDEGVSGDARKVEGDDVVGFISFLFIGDSFMT